MSEIQWLVQLMTKYELNDEVKKLCIERIGEVEQKLTAQPISPVPRLDIHQQQQLAMMDRLHPNQQATNPVVGGRPISQAQLQDMAEAAQTNPVTPQPMPAAQVAPINPLVGSNVVLTSVTPGGSTRGPSKFRR